MSKRKLLVGFIGILFAVAGTAAYAKAFDAGGGKSTAILNSLYCQLAGCTMTGGTVYSNVTTDIDTSTGEDLVVRGGGGSGSSGSVRLWSRDGSVDVLTGAGASGNRIDSTTTIGSYLGQTIGHLATIGARSATEETVRLGDSSTMVSLYGSGKTGYASAGSQSATCTDSGGAGLGALTLDIQSDVVLITNADADGCTVTVSETSAISNVNSPNIRIIVISNAGATVDFADQAGILNLAGAFTMGVEDVLSLGYFNVGADDLYVETSRSNN